MILRIFKCAAIIISLLIFIICCAVFHLAVTFIKPSRRWRVFSQLNRILAITLRKILSVKIVFEGAYLDKDLAGNLILSNHVSYLDGIVLGSVFPVIYLSKKEIKFWPLVGWMAAISGTIFIDRKRKDKTPKYVLEIVRKIKGNANILLFPEGTSTDGEKVLPFQSAFFSVALEAKCPVLPLTIYYTSINNEKISSQNKGKIYWFGQDTFAGHFFRLMGSRNIEVVVKIHEQIDVRGFANDTFGRKRLAEFARSVILSGSPYAAVS